MSPSFKLKIKYLTLYFKSTATAIVYLAAMRLNQISLSLGLE